MKKVHYQPPWTIYTECGLFINTDSNNRRTFRRERVTCKNCKRTKSFKLRAPK